MNHSKRVAVATSPIPVRTRLAAEHHRRAVAHIMCISCEELLDALRRCFSVGKACMLALLSGQQFHHLVGSQRTLPRIQMEVAEQRAHDSGRWQIAFTELVK